MTSMGFVMHAERHPYEKELFQSKNIIKLQEDPKFNKMKKKRR
jgi:hypothetical protein